VQRNIRDKSTFTLIGSGEMSDSAETLSIVCDEKI